MTLDSFVGLVSKIDALRMWQSTDERVRNGMTIYEMEREMAVTKMAGIDGMLFTG